MKKQYIYASVAIFLLTIAIVGSTYAYFQTTVNGTDNQVKADSQKLEIIYTGGQHVSGEKLTFATSKEEGINTTVNIRRAADSMEVQATLYLNISKISNTIANTGFVWEVYKDGVFYKSGNFVNATDNSTIDIVEDYDLLTTDTSFTVYFWLNGNDSNINNNVIGAEFDCTIGARSGTITGDLTKK